MNIDNLSTLEIHKLTQEQYNRLRNGEIEGKTINEQAIYLTPDDGAEEVEFISINDIDEICGGTIEDGVSLTFNNHSVTDDGNGNVVISEGA